jgi:hypothetical protein
VSAHLLQLALLLLRHQLLLVAQPLLLQHFLMVTVLLLQLRSPVLLHRRFSRACCRRRLG